jgi:hypothetical protein
MLRRWYPTYTGNHAIALEVNAFGSGLHRWLDPGAPMGYAGDQVDSATVIKWAKGGDADMRFATLGEFGPVAPVVQHVTPTGTECNVRLGAGTQYAKATGSPLTAPAKAQYVSTVTGTAPAGTTDTRWFKVLWAGAYGYCSATVAKIVP